MNLEQAVALSQLVGECRDIKAGNKLPADATMVDYMGPDSGPFKCANCKYYLGDNKPCAKVSDPVEANGCCNLFEKNDEVKE